MGLTPKPHGDLIRAARRKARYSQAALAELIGARQSSVSKWERGERIPPDAAKVALVEVLEVPIFELFPWLAPAEAAS